MGRTAASLALLAAVLLTSVAAQQAQSRQNGEADPAFVADAQAVADLMAAGFLSPEDAKAAATFDFDSPDGAAAAGDGSGNSTEGYGVVSDGGARLKYTGTAISAYDQEPIASSGAVSLACGFGYVDEDFLGAYIGIGSSFYSKGFSCGRCVKLQCDDKFCSEPGRSLVVQVVDLCGDCYDADLSLAIPAFVNLTGKDPNSNPNVEISWDWVDCAPYINGTIKMLLKPGGNAYFQAFNFANAAIPITAVQLNGERLRHTTSNWWEWNPGQAINPRGPFDLALLGSNKEVLRVRFTQLRSQDLKVQFKAA